MAEAERIKIRIEGDNTSFTKAVKGSEATIKRFRKEADSTSEIVGNKLHKAVQRTATQVAVFQGPLNGVSGRLSSLATALNRNAVGMVAMGGAITGVATGLTYMSRVASQAEVDMARLEGVFSATESSAGLTANAMEELSQEIAYATLASVEGVQQAGAALATFTSVSGETFEEVLRLSQDMAELFGGDLRGNAIRLGRALDDPINGMNALKRSGISFTQENRDLIKHFVTFGDHAAAYGVIMETVAGQVEGTAERVASETVRGAWDTLGQSIDNFFLSISERFGIMDRFRGEMQWFIDLVDKMTGNVQGQYASMDIDELEKEVEYLKERAHWWRADMVLHDKYNRAAAAAEDELRKKRKQAAKDELIALVGQQEDEVRIAQLDADAKIKLAKDTAEAVAKINRESAKARYESMPADPITQEMARYEAELTAIARRYENEEVHLKTSAVVKQAYREREEAAYARHVEIMNQIGLGMDRDHREEELAIQRRREKEADEELAEVVGLEDAKQDIRDNSLRATEAFARGVSDLMKDGSKEQRAALVIEKSIALSRAMINMWEAVSNANSESDTLKRTIAIAEAISWGTQAISGIASVSLAARAGGGPVMPSNKYWVGEHGPEVVSFNRPGNVVKNEDLAPKINVNIIESAEKAGQVEQQGDMVNVFVAAAMRQLNSDFSNGRGLFGQMENKYGLTRR